MSVSTLNMKSVTSQISFLHHYQANYLILSIFFTLHYNTSRITRNTKTLISNIYYNKSLNIIFGSLSSTISDHLIQFLIEPLDFSEKSPKTINRQRCCKNFDKLKFKADLVKSNWDFFALLLIQIMPFSIFSKL